MERGFCFLKDLLFINSSIFLKNEERIIAFIMIMCSVSWFITLLWVISVNS
ncbi:hypothetical protein NEOC84_001376|nr:hypothetical protein [Neochlamydia sp. AcF95]NGY95459.1 hypothetical protein [Neochlamydia sp. AcF84]